MPGQWCAFDVYNQVTEWQSAPTPSTDAKDSFKRWKPAGGPKRGGPAGGQRAARGGGLPTQKQARVNAMQQQGRPQQPPPSLSDPGAARLHDARINALSQVTKGINLVEKKGEDQNYLTATNNPHCQG